MIGNNNAIFVSGIPASGKTSFAKYLSAKLQLPFICKDILKEIMWDKIHYDTSQRENAQLFGATAYNLSFYFVEELMKTGNSYVFESNFMPMSMDVLDPLVHKYNYNALTIMFDADSKVLHDRFIKRDVLPERHPGLKSTSNYFSDYDTFKTATEKIRDFQVGGKIIVDTTDFSKVSYEDIYKQIIDYFCR